MSHRWARPGLSSRRSGEEDTFSPHFFLSFSLLFAFLAFLYFYPSPFILSYSVSLFLLTFSTVALSHPLSVSSSRVRDTDDDTTLLLLDPASATLIIDVFEDHWGKEEHTKQPNWLIYLYIKQQFMFLHLFLPRLSKSKIFYFRDHLFESLRFSYNILVFSWDISNLYSS